jgi:probable F420-dependent oxidoreductase
VVRPFRFGVQASGAADGGSWRDRARRAEALGYSALYMPDHLGDQFGPLVALTAAAEATTTLRVGALVLDNDFRHPVPLAKELATLDLLSGGRLEVGLGAGWMHSDYAESGIPLDPPGTRISRLEEALAVMKDLWSKGTADLDGAHYRVRAAQGLPRPATRPHPPLLIGGGGRRVLSLAAREADIVGVNANLGAGALGPEVAASATAERFAERVAWVREAAGERFEGLELQVLAFLAQVVPNRREVAERLAPLFGLSPQEALRVPIALVGTVDEICDTLVERREEYGFSCWVVHDAELDAFAPVVERLAGT